MLNGPSLIEAGHYYACRGVESNPGVTAWSEIGWKIMLSLKRPEDKNVLFVDDIHALEQMHPAERDQPLVPYIFEPEPDEIVLESEMTEIAGRMLEALKKAPKPALKTTAGRWWYGRNVLTNELGFPNCLLHDLAFTHWKDDQRKDDKKLAIVNIVPAHYEEEQRALVKIFKELRPDTKIAVILFNLEGNWWVME